MYVLLLPSALAGGTGTQAAIKLRCCYLPALLASDGHQGLKGKHRKIRLPSTRSQGRGCMSMPLRTDLEIAFLLRENERHYRYVIKKVSFVDLTYSQFSIIHALADDQGQMKTHPGPTHQFPMRSSSPLNDSRNSRNSGVGSRESFGEQLYLPPPIPTPQMRWQKETANRSNFIQ